MQKKQLIPKKTSSGGRGASMHQAAHGKKQQQSEHTRAQLLRAAEKVFKRDGFEAAKLEEIAALAGYTRGAFYANFESKEDLFLAMAEEHIQERIGKLRQAAESWTFHEPERRLEALRDQFIHAAQDRDWSIIGFELKLFSLRHPELKAKVTALRRRVSAVAEAVLDEQLRRSGVKLPFSTAAFAVALSGITQSLELDRMVDHAISEEEIMKISRLFFDGIVKSDSR